MRPHHLAAIAVAATSIIAVAACGSGSASDAVDGKDDGLTPSGGSGGAGTGGGGGSVAHGVGGATSASGTGAGGGLQIGGQNDGGTVDDASACAATSTKGQLTPVDIFIMLDQSKSMDERVNGVSKWDAVTSALQTFVADPKAAGIGVGLQYFGLMGADNKVSCSVPDYQTAAIDIAALPGNAAAIVASLTAASPNGGTPTAPALAGAVGYAAAWEKAHPDHTTVVVFATDGDPTHCDPQDVSGIAAIAGQGFQGSPAVRTYVIGMAGATTSNLDAWAQAGGTTAAFDANDPTKFLGALNSIRGSVVSCELQIPVPASGTLDYGKVNVQVTDNGQATALSQVAGVAACDMTIGGWYYDNPAAPTRIEICPVSCDSFKSAGQAGVEIDILLGCATVVSDTH